MSVYKLEDWKIRLHSAYKSYKQMYDDGVCKSLISRNFGTANNHYNPNAWRVVGITKDALDYYKSINFLPAKSKIERSHIIDKSVFIDILMRDDLKSANELVEYLNKYDQSILATSSENRLLTGSELVSIKDIPIGLFSNSGLFGMKFRKKQEVEFLKQLK